MSTAAQTAANRHNAQLSTGPRTQEGKSASSLNALKTGLTGRTVLLPNEDADRYSHLVSSLVAEYKPVGSEESQLVQSIADSTWRLHRIPSLKAGIYAVGRLELKDCFPQESDPEIRGHLVNAKIFLVYQRQLNNLCIQESRLRRQEEKDRKRLFELQENRRRLERARLLAAARELLKARADGKASELLAEKQGDIGFEFSSAEMEAAARQLQQAATGKTTSFPAAA